MTHQADITVSEGAIRQAKACGFWTDPEARVRGLAAHATTINHPAGNASYGPFVLLISGKHVLSITMIGPKPVDARPVSACKRCKGMMALPYRTVLEGREGVAYRPCPRAYDPTQPLCDTTE